MVSCMKRLKGAVLKSDMHENVEKKTHLFSKVSCMKLLNTSQPILFPRALACHLTCGVSQPGLAESAKRLNKFKRI